MTYTAADKDGNVLGGGIGPGVSVRLRSLSDYTSALPHISFESLMKEIGSLTDDSGNTLRKLPLFARTTPENILSNLCREIANNFQSVIQGFLKTIGDAEVEDHGMDGVEAKLNSVPFIHVTGGDATLIEKLIEPDCDLIEMNTTAHALPAPKYQVKAMKHMVHYGISGVLKREAKLFKESPSAEMDALLIGQRIAKEFSKRDDDGDYVYRGSVACVHGNSCKHPYGIRYDDGETEEMDVVQLYGMCKCLEECICAIFYKLLSSILYCFLFCRGTRTVHSGRRERSSFW